jgi:UDP-glucose:(heptosyl)LPS alpha-1,3-glucosyltransferase
MEGELLRERTYKRLIALTPSVLEDLKQFYGVPNEDVDILPNGYTSDEFHVGLRALYRVEMRMEIGVPLDAWVVLFVGNEWERKGLLPLMEAIAALGDVKIHLVAVGRLPQAMVQRNAADLGLLGRVHTVSSTSSVNRWFGMADVFALPTVYEAWGMVVIEAMASGLPVLTSSLAGASEAVDIGKNGFLLKEPRSVEEIVDGIERLRQGVLWDSDLISQSVVKYEWSLIFKKYKSILMRQL